MYSFIWPPPSPPPNHVDPDPHQNEVDPKHWLKDFNKPKCQVLRSGWRGRVGRKGARGPGREAPHAGHPRMDSPQDTLQLGTGTEFVFFFFFFVYCRKIQFFRMINDDIIVTGFYIHTRMKVKGAPQSPIVSVLSSCCLGKSWAKFSLVAACVLCRSGASLLELIVGQ